MFAPVDRISFRVTPACLRVFDQVHRSDLLSHLYWIPVYEILEQRGFDVILVNARFAKNVPGRKTDVSDAAWLRQLHSCCAAASGLRPRFATRGVLATMTVPVFISH
jgi:hypothetical protein